MISSLPPSQPSSLILQISFPRKVLGAESLFTMIDPDRWWTIRRQFSTHLTSPPSVHDHIQTAPRSRLCAEHHQEPVSHSDSLDQ